MQLRAVKLARFVLAALSVSLVWGQSSIFSELHSDDENGVAVAEEPVAQQPAPPASTPSPAADANAPATPTAAPVKSIFTVGKVDFSGSVDLYYTFNNNHPKNGFDQLYNFNDKPNQVDLNMAKLSASMDPAPVGFRVDLGLGRVFDNLYPRGTPDPGFFRYVEQAFVSVKPKSLKGFEADFGEFVTSAGAEVIESKDNWNYSRSLLFSWAIPYFHFGIRTSMPIGSVVTVGVQVVNGWNNVIDDTGKNMQTIGLTGAVTKKKFTWSNAFYNGPNVNGFSSGRRNLYDTTLLLTPNDKLNAYLNFDYGHQDRIGGGSDHWVGFAAALRYQMNKYFAFSPRAEVFSDPTGFTTGTAQKLHEVTLTGEYKILEGLISRLEFRHDGSDTPFYQHGNDLATRKTQTTVTIGIIAYFAPKH